MNNFTYSHLKAINKLLFLFCLLYLNNTFGQCEESSLLNKGTFTAATSGGSGLAATIDYSDLSAYWKTTTVNQYVAINRTQNTQ